MALADKIESFLLGDRVTMQPRDTEGNLGPKFTVDASVEEDHATVVQVTRHPVYKGIPVADNGRADPDSLNITVFFSDKKTRIDEAAKVTASALESGTFGTPSVYDTYEVLTKYAKEVALWEIVTSLKTYDNMVLEAVSAPRNVGTGQALQLPLRFTEIRTATITTGTGATKKRDVSKNKKKEIGTQSTPSPEPSLQQKTGPAGLADMILS